MVRTCWDSKLGQSVGKFILFILIALPRKKTVFFLQLKEMNKINKWSTYLRAHLFCNELLNKTFYVHTNRQSMR
jgi:hypothetical protein